MTFTLPDESYGLHWEAVIDTADPLLVRARRRHPAPGSRERLPERALHAVAVALPVLRHRILVNFQAEADGIDSDQIVARLLDAVRV